MELTEQKLAGMEKRAMIGGFTFMWPSEILAMIQEIRSLRQRLDQAEWNEELALIALDHESKDKPIVEETKQKIEQVVMRITQ